MTPELKPKRKKRNPLHAYVPPTIRELEFEQSEQGGNSLAMQSSQEQDTSATPKLDASAAFIQSQLEYLKVKEQTKKDFAGEQEKILRKELTEKIRAETRRDLQLDLQRANLEEWNKGLEGLTQKFKAEVIVGIEKQCEKKFKKKIRNLLAVEHQKLEQTKKELNQVKAQLLAMTEKYQCLLAENGHMEFKVEG